MPKRLRYQKLARTDQLLDELLTLPALQPAEGLNGVGRAKLQMTADGETLVLWVPDDADEAAIEAIVTAHVPAARVVPATPDFGGVATDINQEAAAAVRDLLAFNALSPPTNAQVVANAKLQNQVLVRLIRRALGA